MVTPNNPPPKPKGQGGKAPAFVQPVNPWESAVPNTANSDKGNDSNVANSWQDHAGRSNPGGVGGSK